MSIVYPLAFPSAVEFTDLTFRQMEAVGASRSPFTMTRRRQRHLGQLWVVEAMLAPMKRPLAREMIAFRASLKGIYGNFLLGDVAGAVPRGIATGVPVTDTFLLFDSDSDSDFDSDTDIMTNRVRDEVLYTRGWTPNVTGILKAGDYLQLGSGATSRLYMNLTDVNSDAAGLAVLDIWPRLRADMADASPIVTVNAVGLFCMTSNVMEWSVTGAEIYGIQFTAEEDLSPS